MLAARHAFGGEFGHPDVVCNYCLRIGGDGIKRFLGNPDIIVHEFSHSIVNPLTDKYYDQISHFEFGEELQKRMAKQAYPRKKDFINESIIRAIQPVYMKYLGVKEEFIERNLQNEESLGFVCTRELYAKLLGYQKRKDTNFEKEFVEIANVIKNHFLKEKI